mmetsp:Transcript_22374/g.47027  ORF Transcript_22374/g.47027 Transcript_22374/m.47027 type:complete len:326 (-) Transcript_22374:36-1013(-)
MAPVQQQRIVAVFIILLHTANSYLNPRVNNVHRISPGLPIVKRAIYHEYDSFRIQQSSYIATTYTKNRRGDLSKCPLPKISSSSLEVMNPGRSRFETRNNGGAVSSPYLNTSILLQGAGNLLASLASSAIELLRKYWWSFPMVLALFPPYCVLFKGTYASMPDWWSVVNRDNFATAKITNWSIASFLGSNIAYALSGIYLHQRFRFCERSQRGSLEFRPSRFSNLGVWILVAGLISTIFHSVQALGSYALAESLCYLDHAVAGSATFYFFDTCGIPSKVTSLIGALAITTLVISTPSYAWFHSSWHYLSAAAATRWAIDGYARMS